jgi:hypothetical protein
MGPVLKTVSPIDEGTRTVRRLAERLREGGFFVEKGVMVRSAELARRLRAGRAGDAGSA